MFYWTMHWPERPRVLGLRGGVSRRHVLREWEHQLLQLCSWDVYVAGWSDRVRQLWGWDVRVCHGAVGLHWLCCWDVRDWDWHHCVVLMLGLWSGSVPEWDWTHCAFRLFQLCGGYVRVCYWFVSLHWLRGWHVWDGDGLHACWCLFGLFSWHLPVSDRYDQPGSLHPV